MKLKAPLTLLFTSILISACSSPIVTDVRYDNVKFDPAARKTTISAIDINTRYKIKNLTRDIVALGPDVDETEAAFVAREAILFARHLANEYELVSPPNSQNVLVNTGKRAKGLCYHFASDMSDHIVKGRTYKTLTLQRAVAGQGFRYEHNVLTVAAKGKGVKDAIILDAWRKSADLYTVKTTEDPTYTWSKYKRRTYIVNPEQTVSGKEN